MKKLFSTGLVVVISLLMLVIYTSDASSPGKKYTTDSTETADPLLTWNEGQAKSSIISYVESISDPKNKNFIEPEDRIATFDNDGTLWSEKPFYFQLYFTLYTLDTLVKEKPELLKDELIKAAVDRDFKTLAKHGEHGLVKLALITHGNSTDEEFAEGVKRWLSETEHPTKNRKYNELIFQPMLELMDYLRNNDFKVFIVSGGGRDFMREFACETYGVPQYMTIGSSIKVKYNEETKKIQRLPEMEFIDDKAGKPAGIYKYIGKKPVFVAGNSDGDLQMMQYAQTNEKGYFNLLIHHTDSIREWAYDKESHVGKLDKALIEAGKNNWTVVDMEKDWKTVFPE
ncbi:MAG: HAD family hydrolase [Bacteroidota bacterium]